MERASNLISPQTLYKFILIQRCPCERCMWAIHFAVLYCNNNKNCTKCWDQYMNGLWIPQIKGKSSKKKTEKWRQTERRISWGPYWNSLKEAKLKATFLMGHKITLLFETIKGANHNYIMKNIIFNYLSCICPVQNLLHFFFNTKIILLK